MVDRWHELPKGQKHDAVIGAYQFLQTNQSDHQTALEDYIRLYGGLENSGWGSRLYERAPRVATPFASYNVIRSGADTLTSKIAKTQPKVAVAATDGDWDVKHRAELLDKYLYGQFQNTGLYTIAREVFRDACITGTGALFVYRQGAAIKVERVFPLELWVDELEGAHRAPRQMFRVKSVPRDVAIASFPRHRAALMDAGETQDTSFLPKAYLADQVDLVEAWHLPSGSKPGVHVICCHGATLWEEPWTRDDFPFVFFRYSKRPIGFWGQGVAEILDGIQMQMNVQLNNIHKGFHHLGNPFLFVANDSLVPKGHINNNRDQVNIIRGRTPPQAITFQTIHPEQRQHLNELWDKAFKILGLSELSAQSSKPAGLNSGVALQNYIDIETARFYEVGQDWQDFYMAVAEQIIDLSREAAEAEGDVSISVHDQDAFERISWNDLQMDRDDFVINMYPVNALPERPEGRLQAVQDMFKISMITSEQAFDLLNFPDLKRFQSLQSAQRQVIERTVDRIASRNEYSPPEPFDNLTYAKAYAIKVLGDAKLKGAPEENLESLRAYVLDCIRLEEEAQKPPVQPVPPPNAGVPPGAPPGAPPPGAAPMPAPAPPGAPMPPLGMPQGGLTGVET